MQLTDRLYTSTEVAEILGVSLRSVYRYLEDGKLIAEVKTATGRHRFTKENIINFLYPDGKKIELDEQDKEKFPPVTHQDGIKDTPIPHRPSFIEPPSQVKIEDKDKIEEKEPQEEPVDWLAKFREAAQKYKQEDASTHIPVSEPRAQPSQPRIDNADPVKTHSEIYHPSNSQTEYEQITPVSKSPTLMYYRSMLGGLKDIAQNLDRSARNSNLEYAFTLNAGASLHKPIKPFAILHAYVRSSDRDFYEKILRLTTANKSNAQLCLVISDSSSIYNSKKEIHGLYVVSNDQLKKDIALFGESSLAQEVADIL